tara:strand:+ start:711 stop:1796 length:1086 start_codon:yes stop_codon:yes gene_type:complete
MAEDNSGIKGAFVQLTAGDTVLSTDSVTAAMWSGNNPTLLEYYTSSVQVSSNVAQYYTTVYQTASSDPSAEIQFDIAYCDLEGSGSEFLNPLVVGTSPSRINYGQYRNLVLGDENAQFVFGNQTSSTFYAMPIERARYKQEILPGTWTMNISGASAAGGIISLTDDSKTTSTTTFTDAGRVYNLISGSAGVVRDTSTTTTSDGWSINSGSYGWLLPDIDLILLNASALSGSPAMGGIDLVTSRSYDALGDNAINLVDALNRGGSPLASPRGFTLNSKEDLSSDFYFCRARNSEYNYSANPSFISSSTGAIVFDSFIDNPTTYITTVGLYNESQELLAVAKLSRPLQKDFTKELLVRVKLDF